MSVLASLTLEQKSSLYNVMYADQHPEKEPNQAAFTDVALADTNLKCISRHFLRPRLLQMMEKAGLKKYIHLVPEEPVAVNPASASQTDPPPAKGKRTPAKKTIAAPVPPAAAPVAKSTKKQGKAEPEAPAAPVPTPVAKAAGKTKGGLSLKSQRVLLTIRELAAVAKKGADVSSSEVAAKLGTSTKFVCSAITQDLYPANLLKYEDDTPDGGAEFLYVKLTPAGTKFAIDDSAKTAVLPGPQPGPSSSKKGKRIYKIVEGNPRREGTWGWKSFNALKDGMTVEEYRAAGGRPNDLAWDLQHSYVELRES